MLEERVIEILWKMNEAIKWGFNKWLYENASRIGE